jgi:hypothetical protein
LPLDERIWTIDSEWVHIQNTIVRLDHDADTRMFEYTKVAIADGFSGGPVFDDDGRLVGIHREGAAGGRYAVAVKFDSAIEVLAVLGYNTPNLIPRAAGAPKPRADLPGECVGPELLAFDNWNADVVDNGGKSPMFDTRRFGQGSYCLVRIATYHWNHGQGATPGMRNPQDGVIGLVDGAGKNAGSWPAHVLDNVNWVAEVPSNPPVLLDGAYTVTDSLPATWSQNKASGGVGFARVTLRLYRGPDRL